MFENTSALPHTARDFAMASSGSAPLPRACSLHYPTVSRAVVLLVLLSNCVTGTIATIREMLRCGKRRLFGTIDFDTKNDQSIKTGSGQTQEKLG